MQRIKNEPRTDWVKKVEELGVLYHSLDTIYWDERAYYQFSSQEIDELEATTSELYDMCLAAAQHVIDKDLFSRLAIAPKWKDYIINSWNNEDPALYGRFDLRYDGKSPAKLYEFNGDTPTSLLEASVIQWYWLQDFDKSKDQFNSIHEKLIAYWTFLRPYLKDPDQIHFACMQSSIEDSVTIQYMRDTAGQAGYKTFFMDMSDIGWDYERNLWADLDGNEMKNIFKLYPWEWMTADNEEFSKFLTVNSSTCWIEPPFKMLLSNKGILPILWELYPGHKNLLPAYFSDDEEKIMTLKDRHAIKPLFSREGANIILKGSGVDEETPGDYGKEGSIVQELCPLPNFDGNYPVIGSWIIGQQPAGMGIRESNGLITTNTSRFIPHLFE